MPEDTLQVGMKSLKIQHGSLHETINIMIGLSNGKAREGGIEICHQVMKGLNVMI